MIVGRARHSTVNAAASVVLRGAADAVNGLPAACEVPPPQLQLISDPPTHTLANVPVRSLVVPMLAYRYHRLLFASVTLFVTSWHQAALQCILNSTGLQQQATA